MWLYGWLVLRQTHQSQGIGYVLGGAPVTYREIEDETGFNRRTLEAWMRVLRREGYVRTQNVPAGISVQILRAKKHRPNRMGSASKSPSAESTHQENLFGYANRQESFAQAGVRGDERAVRDSAGRGPRLEVANTLNRGEIKEFAGTIGSSSVERTKEALRCEAQRSPQKASETLSVDDQTSFPWARLDLQEASNDRNLPLSKCKSPMDANRISTFAPGEMFESEARPFPPAKPATHGSRQPQRTNEIANRIVGFHWELRKRAQMIRAEREDELRRELYVGTGPEGRS